MINDKTTNPTKPMTAEEALILAIGEQAFKKLSPTEKAKYLSTLEIFANEQLKLERIKGNIFAEWFRLFCKLRSVEKWSDCYEYQVYDFGYKKVKITIEQLRTSPHYLVYEEKRLKELLTDKTETK